MVYKGRSLHDRMQSHQMLPKSMARDAMPFPTQSAEHRRQPKRRTGGVMVRS